MILLKKYYIIFIESEKAVTVIFLWSEKPHGKVAQLVKRVKESRLDFLKNFLYNIYRQLQQIFLMINGLLNPRSWVRAPPGC